jgi:hypothetical protein
LDLPPWDQPFGLSGIAHDHALFGQGADFDHLAIIGEHGFAASGLRVVDAIEKAHAVADRKRQFVDVAVPVGRVQNSHVLAELAGALGARHG